MLSYSLGLLVFRFLSFLFFFCVCVFGIKIYFWPHKINQAVFPCPQFSGKFCVGLEIFLPSNLIEYIRKAIWSYSFLCGRILNYEFNCFPYLGIFNCLTSFWVSFGKFYLSKHFPLQQVFQLISLLRYLNFVLFNVKWILILS